MTTLVHALSGSSDEEVMLTVDQAIRMELARRSYPNLYTHLVACGVGEPDIMLAVGIHGWTLAGIYNHFQSAGWKL
jgi:hypothetical protein